MKILSPYTMGSFELPHRIVMAPMTRNRAEGTVPGALHTAYYRQRATAAFILTAATQVTPMGQGYPNTPGIHTDEQVEGWKAVTEAVHAEGGRIFLQLWHVGRISHPSFHGGDLPVAPSAIAADGKGFTADGRQVPYVTPRALAMDEIPGIVEQFRQGAERAREAGFDGVEVHGANGYLLDQFLRTGTNQRTDRYGGSVENRARLLLDVTEAVVGVWGSGRVGVRLSPGGAFNDMHDADPRETFSYTARRLAGLDLAYLHGIENDLGDGLTASALLREAYDGTLIMAGGYDRESGEKALQEGRADLIAYARYFLSNPDLPARFARGASLNEWDEDTFYGGGAEGFIDYLALTEQEWKEAA